VQQQRRAVLAVDGQVDLEDVEMVGVAAEQLAQAEQQRRAERRPGEVVEGELRRQQDPHPLRAQCPSQGDLRPRHVDARPVRAPGAMPGTLRVAHAGLGGGDDTAARAGHEERRPPGGAPATSRTTGRSARSAAAR